MTDQEWAAEVDNLFEVLDPKNGHSQEESNTATEAFLEMQDTLTEEKELYMAAQGFFAENWVDADGNPAGGVATGRGFTISYQNGPPGRVGTDERKEPNGAFVEDVVAAIKFRMEYYQEVKGGEFACEENAEGIALLEAFLEVQRSRTRRRVEAGVEGTHEGN